MPHRITHGSLTSTEGARALLRREPVRKVLFFGKNMSRSRCTGALVDALERHGLDVRWLNMATLRRWLGKEHAQRRAERVFRRYRPDLVFVFCRDLPVELLQEFRQDARVVLWVEEPLADLDRSLVNFMTQADLVCLSNPGPRQLLHAHGVQNIVFLMSGFSPRYHRPRRAGRQRRDVVFMGGPGPHGLRAKFLAEVSRHFDTEIFGCGMHWERWVRKYPHLSVSKPVDNVGFQRLCAQSRIVLGLNQVNEDPLYFSNRTFLSLACRAFHLTHYVPGLETVFENGEHLAWYTNTEECIVKIRHYLDAEEERERIAQAGHELVVQEHQYFHRVGRILEVLGTEPAIEPPAIVLPAAPASISAASLSASQ